MNVLLLDNETNFARVIGDFPPGFEKPVILEGEKDGAVPSDSPRVDVIVAPGDFSDRPRLMDRLLAWRTHPNTYLTPCWIASGHDAFARICLWPGLSIDRFDPGLDGKTFSDWLTAVAEWQQYRMQLGRGNSLKAQSVLELISSLALRKATGRLTVFGDDGAQGGFHFREGLLADASIRHLNGMEAFYELFSWSDGSYQWDPDCAVSAETTFRPLHHLITEGLNLIREANLLYHFVPDLRLQISTTESQSALDDLSAPMFEGQEALYGLIDGAVSVSEVIEASPMSRPRTMGCLAKWFSFGDVVALRPAELDPPRRLLIVDDSKLMCHALEEIFSNDPRFEIAGVAHDGLEALKLIDRVKPDVVTMDMQMPRMDGLTALKHIMIRNPRPVVVLSAFTKETSELTYDSFKYGAVDVCTKPSGSNMESLKAGARDIRERVAAASRVKLEAARYIRRSRGAGKASDPAAHPLVGPQESYGRERSLAVIICGAGGFPSLLRLLFSVFRSDSLPHAIVCMAMPPRVVESLTPHLERDCKIKAVAAAPPGADLTPSVFSLHSYEHRCAVEREDGRVRLQISESADSTDNPFDRLLGSASQAFGERTAAFLLSGAGDDGVAGMRGVRENGGKTFVLSPRLCLKPDLPRKVLEAGHADEIETVAELASLLETLPSVLSGDAHVDKILKPGDDLRDRPSGVEP